MIAHFSYYQNLYTQYNSYHYDGKLITLLKCAYFYAQYDQRYDCIIELPLKEFW